MSSAVSFKEDIMRKKDEIIIKLERILWLLKK